MVRAEVRRFGEFRGGVEAFEKEGVGFQRGGYHETVVENAENDAVNSMGEGGKGQERGGGHRREEVDEELGGLVNEVGKWRGEGTSLGSR